MLLEDDLKLLDYLTDEQYSNMNTNSELSILEKIIFYEKKFGMNSFDILYSDLDEPLKSDFRNCVIEYLRANGNIRIINNITPIMYYGIPSQTKEITKRIINNIFSYYPINSAIVLSNKNPLYKKIISLANRRRKMVVLFTNDKNDFKLGYSNLVIIYTNKPNFEVVNFSTKYYLPVEQSGYSLGRLYQFKDKIIYV